MRSFGKYLLSTFSVVLVSQSVTYGQNCSCAAPSCSAPSCSAPSFEPSCAAPGCDGGYASPSCGRSRQCGPSKVINFNINICKGDKTKIKRNTVLGSFGEFATGTPAPQGFATASAPVLNVQTFALPITLGVAQPAATTADQQPIRISPASAQPVGAASSSETCAQINQIRDDVDRLTNLVDGLVKLEHARSAAALKKIDEAAEATKAAE